MATQKLTAERLRELLDYDPMTGIFTRRSTSGRWSAGSVSGARRWDGYFVMNVANGKYLAHRLAWLYYFGKWPSDNIDHRDRNPGNNRIANLREASKSVNAQNIAKPRIDNTTGVRNVTFDKQTQSYAVKFTVNQREVFHKRYASLAEAKRASDEARKKFHPGCV